MKSITVLSANDALKTSASIANDFVAIKNPKGLFPEFEIVPMAPVPSFPLKGLDAVLMDMDGTTTSTEVICIHSLEFMVRKITGKMTTAEWKGLDHHSDYPHIIGNSTTKHIEYLLHTYGKSVQPREAKNALIEAAVWTLTYGKDPGRRTEVLATLSACGISSLANEKIQPGLVPDDFRKKVAALQKKFAASVNLSSHRNLLLAAIDIYYVRYHSILQMLLEGKDKEIRKIIGLHDAQNIIEPMPGIAVLLPLLAGLLGDEAVMLAESVAIQYALKHHTVPSTAMIRKTASRLKSISIAFTKKPVKLAVVTSSIRYEADIVLEAVFSAIRSEIKTWEISESRKRTILKQFSHPGQIYTTIVTASDSNEIRLKPHRDLYSIALRTLGIDGSHMSNVIGFEDSESGTVAIRCAGVGASFAVPFAQTSGHNFDAAAKILHGGIPEAIIDHKLFIK